MKLTNAPTFLTRLKPLSRTGERAGLSAIPAAELTPRVREALQSLSGEVAELRAALSASRARIGELEQLADTDELTGILNRRGFTRELQRAIAIADRYQTPSSLVFLDLNDLKIINDNFGHPAGDAAIAHVARTISGNVRKSDVVGRLGGDEFAVILTQTTGAGARAKASSLAERIAAAPVDWSGPAFNVSVAIGSVEISQGSTAADALAAADQAMYASKRGG